MRKSTHALELADYLLQEGGGDGATIGVTDAKICASALKFYARARRGAALLAVVTMPIAVLPFTGSAAEDASGQAASRAIAGMVGAKLDPRLSAFRVMPLPLKPM